MTASVRGLRRGGVTSGSATSTGPATPGALVALLLALSLALAGCGRGTEIAPPAPAPDRGAQRAQAAQEALDLLTTGLSSPSASAVRDLAAPGQARALGLMRSNARALGLTQVSFRYVLGGGVPSAEEVLRYGEKAWVGRVESSFAVGGFDRRPARMELDFVFVPGKDDGPARIAGLSATGSERRPLWLTGPLRVVRRGETLVMVSGNDAGRFPELATSAVRQVRRVLGSWEGPLVVEVPTDEAGLNAAVGASQGQYANIAAVTTTVDGSLVPDAPVHVFINPSVFGALKERGAQVVMTHEATHVATRATFASMPHWLLEGFADYVALTHSGVPVEVAAGQILPELRKHGLPTRLPTSADLDPTANRLGASYEEAWLACRFLASRFGEEKLIAFYRAVDGGRSVGEAFGSVLGTNQREFVKAWRQDLADLAGLAG